MMENVGICSYILGPLDAVNGLTICTMTNQRPQTPSQLEILQYPKLPSHAWITKEAIDSLQRGAQSSVTGVLSSTSGSTSLTHKLELCNVTGR